VKVIINVNVVTCGFASSHNQEWRVLECRNFNSERLGSVGHIFIPSLKVTLVHHILLVIVSIAFMIRAQQRRMKLFKCQFA